MPQLINVFTKESNSNKDISKFKLPLNFTVNNKHYILKLRLVCKLEKEENYYLITNEEIDITATGLTIEETFNDFYEDFDFLYSNFLKDGQLSNRLIKIKSIMDNLVETVVPNVKQKKSL